MVMALAMAAAMAVEGMGEDPMVVAMEVVVMVAVMVEEAKVVGLAVVVMEGEMEADVMEAEMVGEVTVVVGLAAV